MTETLIPAAPAVAPETVTPLRPSEALRLGRLTRPVRIEGSTYGASNEACAGGAMLAGYGDRPAALAPELRHFWDALRVLPCPMCGPRREAQIAAVPHLNDDHHWSDDQIVAWLESRGL